MTKEARIGWLIHGVIATLANRLWDEVENPNWVQSLLLYPEDVKGWQHAFWQLMMMVAEWAERLSVHIQDHFNEATQGEWAKILDGLDEE